VLYARARLWDAHGGTERSGQRRLLSASPQVQPIVPDGVTPEQAVDEAIARIKQILSE
jgi:hypothetical protein